MEYEDLYNSPHTTGYPHSVTRASCSSQSEHDQETGLCKESSDGGWYENHKHLSHHSPAEEVKQIMLYTGDKRGLKIAVTVAN